MKFDNKIKKDVILICEIEIGIIEHPLLFKHDSLVQTDLNWRAEVQ